MKYRKRPVEVEAFHYTGDNLEDALQFAASNVCHPCENNLVVRTLEGDMMALPGDWLIRGIAGELYPCKAEIFDATYEPVEG